MVEDGVTGLLVPFGDADQLARAAEKLIQDVPLRAALGRAAKSQAQTKFSADVIVPRYEALYRGQCVKAGELVQCSNKV